MLIENGYNFILYEGDGDTTIVIEPNPIKNSMWKDVGK